MPQMAPMNWLNLFVIFNLCLFVLMSKLNFLYKERQESFFLPHVSVKEKLILMI